MEVALHHKVKYIARRHEEWQVAQQALEKRDLPPLMEMGHKWKGNGSTFGFPELGTLGEKLEDAAAEKRLEEVRALIAQFKTWLAAHPVPA
jgi:HPt (histidine-containing phosphotransfer) domain-containing protein